VPWRVLAILLLALGAGAAWFAWRASKGPATPTASTASMPDVTAAPEYVGAEACAGCHAPETGAWKTSQHALAMQHANADTMLGDFDDARFTYGGVTSRFFRQDDGFWVNTDGPDGTMQEKGAPAGRPFLIGRGRGASLAVASRRAGR